MSIILACNHLPAVALTLYSSWSTIFTWWPALPTPALNLFPGVSIDNVSILLGHLLPSMLQYFGGWPGSLPPWPQGSPLAACWRKKVSECGETPRSCPNSSISSTKEQKYQYQNCSMGRPGHILTLALVEPQYHNQWHKYQSS